MNYKDAIGHLIVSEVLAKELDNKIPLLFFNDIRNALDGEQRCLSEDKHNYLQYITTPICERICEMDFEGSVQEIYEKANDPKSSIRNGLILYGLYINKM
jgi:hypothetical protein